MMFLLRILPCIEVTDDVHGNLTYRVMCRGRVYLDLTIYSKEV